MLQNIRQNVQGTVAKIVVGLIVISFSIFGIESILLGGGGGEVAEVNGEAIEPGELQQAVTTLQRQLIAMMGDNVDLAQLDDQALKSKALDDLIQRKLLLQAADGMDLAVSERDVGRVIAGMEQFQVDGKFSPDLYRAALSSAGFSPAYFKRMLGEDMVVNQLRSGLAGSEFSTPAELALGAGISAERRDLRYLTIPTASFASAEEPTDDQIQQFYRENPEQFSTPETVELDYIDLVADDFRQPVDDSALQEAYQLEITNNQYRTESRVSHILFEQRDGEASADVSKRIAAARELLSTGADFGEVAKQFSDDVGSAGTGGDLGWTSGDTFPEEMEAAIATLEPGQVSEPVTTDAGVHLIEVTDRREGKAPTLEELRPKLVEQLQLSGARVELLRTVESLRDLAFNAESLAGPAEELGLEVRQSGPVARNQGEGLFANSSLLGAAFSEEVLGAGHNSEVIELGEDHFVVLRVRKHNEPAPKPLAEVRDDIAGILKDTRARAAVARAAEAALESLRQGGTLEQVAEAGSYELRSEPGAERQSANVPPDVLQRAFQLPAPDGAAPVVDLLVAPNGDARVIALDAVVPGSLTDLDDAERRGLQQRLTTEYATMVDSEFRRGLRARADISVL